MARKTKKPTDLTKEEIENISQLMDNLIEDTTVPRNIRAAVEEAKQKVLSKEEVALKLGAAIYILDDISNDINMPSHARTELWAIISELEALKEKYK